MRIGTVFSGIGSPEQAAKRVYDDLDLVFACEWDKYARQSFEANYDIDVRDFHKDICDMDGTQYKNKIDILIGGSPCQDYSLGGLRAGVYGEKGVLIYEYFRIIDQIHPPIFIYENVIGMLSDRNGKTVKEFVEAFRRIGYNCHYGKINTKDYGVPQNRERIFIVGFKDLDHYYNFHFAPKIKLVRKLKDILESEVDEKYYLSEKAIKCFEGRGDISPGYKFKPQYGERNANCLVVKYGNYSTCTYLKVKQGTKKGYDIAKKGDSINLSFPNSTTRRGRVGKGVAQTLDCACNQATIEDERIRKLTPRECFRLQDFPDTFKQVVSNSQAYKQAGNSISVNVIEMIFRQIEASRYGNTDKGSLF